MKYFAVFLPLLDQEKSQQLRPQHLDFLEKLRNENKVFANGPFVDGSGGLVIYVADSYEEVEELVKQDPFIIHGARGYDIHEWAMVKGNL